MSTTHHPKRRGLTLLEVLLSIAIFGGALVAIGELIRIGSMSAATARDLSEAQRHCNNVMAEVGANIKPPESTSQVEVEGYPGWLYSIEAGPVEGEEGLLTVTVAVEQDPSKFSKPLKYKLVRWMTDPAAVEATKAAAEADAAAATSTSSSTSSGASGNSSGGSPSGSSTKAGGSSGS